MNYCIISKIICCPVFHLIKKGFLVLNIKWIAFSWKVVWRILSLLLFFSLSFFPCLIIHILIFFTLVIIVMINIHEIFIRVLIWWKQAPTAVIKYIDNKLLCIFVFSDTSSMYSYYISQSSNLRQVLKPLSIDKDHWTAVIFSRIIKVKSGINHFQSAYVSWLRLVWIRSINNNSIKVVLFLII